MKEYTIGRGNDSDIVIPDESDQVSRKHCVLRIFFWGKMLLNDNSSNGTFVNGETLEPGTWYRVSRKDTVSLGKVWDLDWDEIPSPYRIKRIILSLVLLLLLGGGGTAAYIFRDDLSDIFKEKKINMDDIEEENSNTAIDSTKVDTLAVDTATAPVKTPSKKQTAKPKKKKNAGNNHNKSKEEKSKPETENSRIRAGEMIL